MKNSAFKGYAKDLSCENEGAEPRAANSTASPILLSYSLHIADIRP